MLKISLDEAYVFDLLSIYEVKYENSMGDKKDILKNSIVKLSNEIIEQIGEFLFYEIIKSEEYENLKSSNKLVFTLVERANETKLSKLTAESNYQRYVHKTNLQNKFFIDKLTEIKLNDDSNIT